mmetsp:Transcript_31176/g.77600  ORF Transcript_31176/g.77600 Transcript_31176/m.77600 type:complete len:217 (+) Transcript_31176:173-823(+)
MQNIKVPPPLLLQWHVPPPHRHLPHVQLAVHGSAPLVTRGQDLGEGIHGGGVPPRLVRRPGHASRAAGQHEALVVHGPRPLQQLPVQGASHGVERPRVHQYLRPAVGARHRQLGEPEVEAYADAQAPHRRVHHGELVAGRQCVTFLERDLTRDVDVEQVGLAVPRNQRALGVKHAARVIQQPGVGALLGDAAAHQHHPALPRRARQHRHGLRTERL